MHIIDITVRDKIATHVGDAYYVCGNSDFVVRFDFDEEWDALDVKTARFIREDGAYHDQVFSGSECPVPIISNTNNVRVGVFAGNLSTTTAARVPAVKSILCPGGVPASPGDDVYNQIMEEVNETRGVANETAQALQEACGNTGLYLVRVESNKADRSYEEIVAAINAGKPCLLVDGFSRVFTFSEISSGTIIFRAVHYGVPLGGGAYTVITVREFHIAKDGTTRNLAISPANATNPRKLTIKQGNTTTEYDGSEEIVVEIPQGGGGEEAETVILEEHTVELNNGYAPITAKPSAQPVDGAVYRVTFNGGHYYCTAVLFVDGALRAYALGDFSLMENAPVPGNPFAPFLLLIAPDGGDFGQGATYGALLTKERIDGPVTLAVTGEGAAEDAGSSPFFEVRVPISFAADNMVEFGKADKTWAEVEAAHNAGKIIRVIGTASDGTTTAEYYGDIKNASSTDGGLYLGFEMYTNYYMNEAGRSTRVMYGGASGEIVFIVPD